MSFQGQPLQVLFFSYLLVLPEQEVDHTFELFVTGVVCHHWGSQSPAIVLWPGTRIALHVVRSRHAACVENEEQFKELIYTALKGSLGFGKACDFIWSNCALLWTADCRPVTLKIACSQYACIHPGFLSFSDVF